MIKLSVGFSVSIIGVQPNFDRGMIEEARRLCADTDVELLVAAFDDNSLPADAFDAVFGISQSSTCTFPQGCLPLPWFSLGMAG